MKDAGACTGSVTIDSKETAAFEFKSRQAVFFDNLNFWLEIGAARRPLFC
jgi:hypothetical protein